jgi:hypothetical protein
MKTPRKEGILRVIQLAGNLNKPQTHIRDFDGSEWSHDWLKRGGADILRVMHDNADNESDSFEFVEFSTPVMIEFIAED